MVVKRPVGSEKVQSFPPFGRNAKRAEPFGASGEKPATAHCPR
jgi:hypothetical protein